MRDKGEISDYAVYVAVTDWDDFLQASRENPTARSAPVALTQPQSSKRVPWSLFVYSWRLLTTNTIQYLSIEMLLDWRRL